MAKRIAYRRVAGPIGLSAEESGTRGMWWEKRRNLFAELRRRGHQVDLVNRLTRPTRNIAKSMRLRRDHDILMLEFGSSNRSFYGHDIDETAASIAMHRGPIVFICDDPDLPFNWPAFPNEDWSRWHCWYNAVDARAFGHQPAAVTTHDFPFSALTEPQRSPHNTDGPLVYFGRPTGRTKAVMALAQAKVPLVVAGRTKEWAAMPYFTMVNAPPQPLRSRFYAAARASVVLADMKHKRLKWRTGRAYHAILAGCPALVEHDHLGLLGLDSFSTPQELMDRAQAWEDPRAREDAWERQAVHVREQQPLCERALQALGL